MAEKKQGAKFVKDEGFITIDGKPYEVNKNSPDIETLNNTLGLVTFQKDYEQILKTIEILNEGKDGLLAKGYDDNFIEKLNGFDKNIELQKSNLTTLFVNADKLFKGVIIFYLGPDITETIDKLGFLELVELVNKCNEQNKHIKAAINKAK